MKYTLRNGPWRTLFEGVFQTHEMEILINPDEIMVVAAYDKEGSERVGVVLQAFSIYSVVGEAETFVESLQREAIIISRHDGKRTIQFFALTSQPVYAKTKDEEIAKAVDGLLDNLAKSGKKIEGVAKSFDLKLTKLEECSNAVKQAFFSQPAIIPMLAREKETIRMEKEEASVESGVEGAAIILGTTKGGKAVKEPVMLFQRALVTDGNLEQRVHFIQIIVESYLLANIPAVIFDEGNNFNGLSHPTKKLSELKAHGVSIEPIGFPVKHFEPGKNLKVNLNVVSPANLLQMFGLNDKEAEKILAKAFEKGKVKSPVELIRKIDSLGSDETENQFLKRRLERAIALIDKLYPELFDGETELDELAKGWFKKIGKASIVHVDKMDPRALTLLLDSISNEFINRFKKEGETGKPKMLFVVPQVEKLFSIRDNLALKDFIKMLAEMKKFGISFVVGTEKRTDLVEEMKQLMETKIGVIKKDDVAVDLPNSKSYRILVRPTLSITKEET